MLGHTFSQPAYNLTSTSVFTVQVIRELKVHQQQSEDLHFTRFWHFFCSRHISKLLIKHAIANSPCYHYYNMINMMWTQGKRHLCIWDGLVRAAHRGVALEGAATWGNHLAGRLSVSVCPTVGFGQTKIFAHHLQAALGGGLFLGTIFWGQIFLKPLFIAQQFALPLKTTILLWIIQFFLRSAILDSQSMWLFH